MQVELEYRQGEGMNAGNLARNLRALQEELMQLRDAAAHLGLNPDEIQKKHGKLNVREVCKRFGIEKAYLVNYAYCSSHVHEKNVATRDFYAPTPDEHAFNLGPVPLAAPHAIADALTGLAHVLDFASQIVEDQAAVTRSQDLLHELSVRTDRLCRASQEKGLEEYR